MDYLACIIILITKWKLLAGLAVTGAQALPCTKNAAGAYLDEKCLVKGMLDDYDIRARPVLDSSKAVNVYFGITPVQISDLDEVNQVLSVNVWLQHIWVDERLKWDPRIYNNLTKLRLPQSSIWLPDIVLYNSAEDYAEVMKTKITVDYTGEVFWGPPTRYRASCQINVKYFPFDVQECSMKFSSWMYDGTQLNLSMVSSQVDLDNYLPNGEWELIDITAERSSIKYECCPDPYPFVTYKFIIKRRVLYYLFNIVFPCLWLAILSVMTFWLPPDSGEKITLGITVLLAFSVFMLLVAESMPKTSESVPLIGIYLFVTMSLTSSAIILTIFVLQIHHVGPRQRRMPMWIRTFAFDYLARVLCIRSIVHNFLKEVTLEDGIARFPRPAKMMSTPDLVCTYAMELANHTSSNSHSNGCHGSHGLRHRQTGSELQAVISDQIKANNKYKRQKEEQKAVGDEWRLLAIVLDRLFFWIYTIVTLCASIGILLLMPAAGEWFRTKKNW